ncbi:Semaphorin-4E [Geodia barretti]|uniref:Semaphorin-4E n=1 Tax=Geodia barretti TaxID=519541 RepID=A0AA35SW50_GEOBA|nr:Semaphorin-4E [Geodia barretti]
MTHTRTHTHTHRENDKFPKNQERKKIFTLQILEKPYSFTFPLVPPILPSLTSSPLPLLSQCTTDRSATEANERHLMSDTAHQTSGDRLHLQLTGYSFKKILVAAVTDLAGNTHDVMYITSTKEGSLVLLKTLYDATRQESLVISEQELKLSEDTTTTDATSGEPPAIIHMQLLGNGTDAARDAVYVGTTEALYRFPVANCGQFSGDCCACVASRDPHCAYDPVENKCVSVYGGVTGIRLLQDVANGDIAACSAPPGSNETTPTPTRAVDTPVTVETKTGDPYSTVGAKPSPTSEPVRPSLGGVTGEQEASQSNYQWTIIGTICAFVGGIILGILVMAFVLKNKGRFIWNKFISSSRRPTVQSQPAPPSTSNKGACNKDTDGASNFTDKAEMYERNNCDMNPHGNAAAVVVHLDPISNLPTYINHRHYGNGKQGTKGIEPPPYSPNKPTVLPSNGAAAIQLEMTDGDATPTTSHHSTPEHKRNKPQPNTPPENKTNKPSPTKNLPLSTPPKPSTPPSMQTMPKSSQTTPTKPSTPSKATPPSQLSPLTLTPAHKHQYCRAQSHPHHYTSSHPHQTPPPSGHYSTLPLKKKRHSSTSHSETTPPKRPSSVEGPPNFSLPRPSSAQNLNHVFRARSATMATAMTMPTKQRPGMVPLSPFSAHHHQSQGGIPSSPYSNGGAAAAGTPVSTPYSNGGAAAAGTPVSTTSSGGSHGPSYFKFPSSPGGKLPEGAPAGIPFIL